MLANASFGKYPWARIIQMPTTIYMENWMYFEYLDAHRDTWQSYDYVGTLSWKAPKKMIVPDMTKLQVIATDTNPDVIALLSYPKKSLLEQASEANFECVWIEWLKQLGYDETASKNSNIPLFLCNYWMAKPEYMSKYIAFAKTARYILDTYQPIREKLWSDSKFPFTITADRCRHIFGRPYYPLHCFLMERLPCIFFHYEKALVLHCRFWKLNVTSGLWQYVGIREGTVMWSKPQRPSSKEGPKDQLT
jgi:hypothetical protein